MYHIHYKCRLCGKTFSNLGCSDETFTTKP